MDLTSLSIALPAHDPFWQPSIASAQPANPSLMASPPQMPAPQDRMANESPLATAGPISTLGQGEVDEATPSAAQTPVRRTFQCTHMDMLRVYHFYDCQLCGEVPDFGFVYVCCQDNDQLNRTLPSKHIIELSKDSATQTFEAQSYMAEALGMSQSVVKQIRTGFYTTAQIQILFEQRRHVIEVLRGVLESEANDKYHNVILEQNATDSENLITDTNDTQPESVTLKAPPCDLRVCHSCKPYLRDRIYSQPTTIIESGLDWWDMDDIVTLPVRNAAVLKGVILPGEAGAKTPEHHSTARLHDLSKFSTTPISISSSEYSDNSSDVDMFPLTSSGDDFQFSGNAAGRTTSRGDWAIGDMMYHPSPAFENRRLQNVAQMTPLKRHPQLEDTPSTTSYSPFTNSSGSPSDATSPLTPLRQNEETFEASFEKKSGTFAKSASFCGPFRLQELSQVDNNTSRDDGSRDQDGNTDGGLRITEESIETGVPDLIAIDTQE